MANNKAENNKEHIAEKELFDIIADVKRGNDESFSVLKKKYFPLMKAMVRSFEDGAADISDYEKEAESALLKAALKFNSEQKEVAFGLFAKVCIRNALISLRRKEMSKKRRAERGAGRLHGGRRMWLETFDSHDSLKTDKLVKEIREALSAYERRVFDEFMSGKSIEEIAMAVGKPKKSVNNAICRIKAKVKALDLPI